MAGKHETNPGSTDSLTSTRFMFCKTCSISQPEFFYCSQISLAPAKTCIKCRFMHRHWMTALPELTATPSTLPEGYATLYKLALEGAKAGFQEFAKAVNSRLDGTIPKEDVDAIGTWLDGTIDSRVRKYKDLLNVVNLTLDSDSPRAERTAKPDDYSNSDDDGDDGDYDDHGDDEPYRHRKRHRLPPFRSTKDDRLPHLAAAQDAELPPAKAQKLSRTVRLPLKIPKSSLDAPNFSKDANEGLSLDDCAAETSSSKKLRTFVSSAKRLVDGLVAAESSSPEMFEAFAVSSGLEGFLGKINKAADLIEDQLQIERAMAALRRRSNVFRQD